MGETAHQLWIEVNWRMKTLLRTRKYYDTKMVVRLYKCHILSFLEGATPAIYHAAPSVLKPLDELQRTLLEKLGLSLSDGLLNFNLTPLGMRRDIAMLGILFKVAHGIGPLPIRKLFSLRLATLEQHGFLNRLRHTKQIMDPVAFNHPVMIKRSIFGLIRIWNALPQIAIDAKTVKIFQRYLQDDAKKSAHDGKPRWESMYHLN